MERRKASPEQLNLLLNFLEVDKDLAVGKFTGLEGRIRQTNAWIKITEKLNANSGFGSGAIKTPDKWQQTWRDWKSNVKKKAFKIRKNRFTPGCNSNSQLTDSEEKILRLICTNTSAFGLSETPETKTVFESHDNINTAAEHGSELLCNSDLNSSSMKWPSESQNFREVDVDTSFADAERHNHSGGLTQEKLLMLEEEKIKIEKQKLLENKRCNNIRLKIEKDRLETDRQRNLILEKLLAAVESLAQRQVI